MCRPGWQRTATDGMMSLIENRALRRLLALVSIMRVSPGSGLRGVTHGRTFHRLTDGILRVGCDPGEALHRDAVGECHLLQPASQELWLAPAAAVLVSERRCRGGA